MDIPEAQAAYGVQDAMIGRINPETGAVEDVGPLPSASVVLGTEQPYDPDVYLSILQYIITANGLTTDESAALNIQIQKAFRDQPVSFNKSARSPVSINGLAICYGVMIGLTNIKTTLKVSRDLATRWARDFDPYKDVDPQMQKSRHREAIRRQTEARRRGGR